MTTIKSVLEQYNYLPSCVVLGSLQDDAPVLLDLYDAKVGSLLYVGQDGNNEALRDAMMDALRSIFESAAMINSHYEVKAAIITSNPQRWDGITSNYDPRYTIEVVSSASRRAGDLIMEMSAKAEQRIYGRELGPAILVIIDNLKDIYRQDYDATLNFEWLLREGAKSQVWPIAVVWGEDVDQLPLWVSSFKVHINQAGPVFEVKINGQPTMFKPLE